MNVSEEKKMCRRSFLLLPSNSDAFYSVYKLDGIYFVTMYYNKAFAVCDAKSTGGKIISYSKLLSQLGNGKTFFFKNFYLS